MRITNKSQMYRLLAAGEFGNTMPVFTGLEDALSSGVTPLGVRSLNVSDPVKLYWVPREELVDKLTASGALHRSDLVFYSTDYGWESDRIIQGELQRDERGLYFFYSFAHQPMRIALEQAGLHAMGLSAEMILRRYVRSIDPTGYDWLMELLDRYEGHVIEFTTYRRRVGTLGQKTLIWECRNY